MIINLRREANLLEIKFSGHEIDEFRKWSEGGDGLRIEIGPRTRFGKYEASTTNVVAVPDEQCQR